MSQANDPKILKRKQGRTSGRAARFNDAVFVRYELDDTQKAELKGMSNEPDALFAALCEEIDNGYKFTLGWDAYGECYGCFMVPNSNDCPNKGAILTGRGSSPLKAVKQVLYKHRVALDGEWMAYTERRGTDPIDD